MSAEQSQTETSEKKPSPPILIITGMSGAGKSQVMATLEDIGFFCIDNLPASLLMQTVENLRKNHRELPKLAVVVDIRGGESFSNLRTALADLKQEGLDYRVIFLDASEDVLISRYKATRRRHPLSADGLGLTSGIKMERERLEEVHELADFIYDTSDITPQQLFAHICELFSGQDQLLPTVSVYSFGFKYGLPIDADLVIDVRFLPNPYYIPELKPLTGHQPKVRDYVLKKDAAREFLRRYMSLLRFLLPQYRKEGKRHLLVAVGCTGGRHRSVAISEEMAKRLRRDGYRVMVSHRDVER